MTPARHAGGADCPTSGFSLVEMLVVLAVIGLAAALGGPTLAARLPGYRLDAAAEALANEIALLRTEATRTGQRTNLVYDPETARFLSSRRAAPMLAMSTLSVSVAVPPGSRSNPGEIRFLPGGATTGGRIVLSAGGARRVLTVSRVTGAVRRGEAVP